MYALQGKSGRITSAPAQRELPGAWLTLLVKGLTMKLYERLMKLVKVSTVNNWNGMSCLEWQGSRTAQGYGRITVGSKLNGTRKLIAAHRASWQEFRGPIPEGLCVLHRCDNPSCCNPAHLFLGTNLDNVNDRTAKGRNVNLRGEDHGRAKLRPADVLVIRKLLADGETNRGIASKCGVSHATIARIRQNRSWAHVA